MNATPKPSNEELTRKRRQHAAALVGNALPACLDLTLSEALVLGLLRQEVHIFFTVLGHGSTEVGEVLRLYQEAGLVRVYGLRSEIEASHAASALRWVTGEKAAAGFGTTGAETGSRQGNGTDYLWRNVILPLVRS